MQKRREQEMQIILNVLNIILNTSYRLHLFYTKI